MTKKSREAQMRMTKRQFDHAVDQILGGVSTPLADDELERHARIKIAALFVIKQRQGVSDDVDFHAPPEPELRSSSLPGLALFNASN